MLTRLSFLKLPLGFIYPWYEKKPEITYEVEFYSPDYLDRTHANRWFLWGSYNTLSEARRQVAVEFRHAKKTGYIPRILKCQKWEVE